VQVISDGLVTYQRIIDCNVYSDVVRTYVAKNNKKVKSLLAWRFWESPVLAVVVMMGMDRERQNMPITRTASSLEGTLAREG
jgi:hypothetical protein